MNKRAFDRIMFQKVTIAGAQCRVVDIVFVACLLVLAFLMRISLLPFQSADYYGCLKVWMEEIRKNGGFRSMGVEISNYPPAYMYIMCLLSYISRNDLYALKLVSILFDYVAAFAMFLLVWRLSGNLRRAILGMTFLLFSPAVVINGAYWAQCDMIYAAFVLIALCCFFRGNSNRCLFFVGIAFAFKLQTVFILPFLLMMWAKRRTILLRHFLWLPVIYAVSAVPAALMGRNLRDVLLIYVQQTGTYPWGTMEYPNMYALLDEAMPNMHHAVELSGAGLWMMVMILGGIAYYVYTQRVRLTKQGIVSLALLTLCVVAYTMPHMHERYGILIDLIALLYAMLDTRKLPLYFGFSLISVVSFMPFLIGVDIVPIQYTAIALLGLILYVGYDCRRLLSQGATALEPSL